MLELTARAMALGLVMAAGLASGEVACAQGLIWNLPADGTEVVYGGTVSQANVRSDGQESTITWDRQLVIRSVGAEQVARNGKQVPARWLEFEARTGRSTEQGIVTGPGSARIYRVLVPEAAITGKPADERGIPNTFLPIIEGYKKIGDQPRKKLTSSAFETFPSLTQLMNYKPNEITPGDAQPVDVPAGQFTATSYTASAASESPSRQAKNKATLLVSPKMPFGLVRWNVTTTRSKKDPNQPRDAFEVTSTVTTEMEARAINENARPALAPAE